MLKRGFQFAPGYRLQEFLGRGQFGQVWRASAPGGAAMAAKFIDLSDGQGQKEYDGVKRVKQIRHANLMPITAIWLLDGQGRVIEEAPNEELETIDLSVAEAKGQSAVYEPAVEPSWLVVAMLLGGKSLQQRLRECVGEGQPGIPPRELISYMDESAKGIDFLNSPQHDLGEGPIAIQHCDIKPANIVLIGNSAVVCDFGLARILTRNQVTATSAAGTPAYMAPEAISGKPSRTSDQYSLAVTYYHLRTGTLPVNDGSLWEVLDAHRQGKLKLGLVPESEQEVLRKATDLKWEDRFETCVEMVDSLREALRAEGHTTPSFVPKSRANETSLGNESAGTQGQTKSVQGDPTATLDLPASEASPGQATQPTAPFAVTEESTKKEGFLKKTIPELQESPAASVSVSGTQTQSAWDVIRSHPKILAGIAAGLIVLLGLAAVVIPSDSTEPVVVAEGSDSTNGGVDGTGPVVDVGVVNPQDETVAVVQDPAELLSEAIAKLDSDESTATEKFNAALALNPELATPEVMELKGHQTEPVRQMLQANRGSTLVSLGRMDPAPTLWDLDAGSDQPTKLESAERRINTMVLSPDGARLLIGGRDSSARLWNLKASDIATSVLELPGHKGEVEDAAWHVDGEYIVTSDSEKKLRVWKFDPPTGDNPDGAVAEKSVVPVEHHFHALASDPQGNWLAAKSLGSQPEDDVFVFPWSELTDEVQNAPIPKKLGVKGVEWIDFLTGDEPLLATGDMGGTISIYSVPDGELKDRSDTGAPEDFITSMRVAFVKGRNMIVAGSAFGSVHCWEYPTMPYPRTRIFSPAKVGGVSVSSDGRWVAAGYHPGFGTGQQQGSVWLWDTTCSDQDLGAIRLFTGESAVDSVLLDSNGRWLIAGCSDGVIRMWDLRQLKLLALTQPTPPSGTETTITIPDQLSMR